MADTATQLNVTVSTPWEGAGQDWPSRSTPASGAEQTEACWQLGLSATRFEIDRDLGVRGVAAWTQQEAQADREAPTVVRRLLELEGVDAVLVKGSALFVSAREGGRWDALKGQVEDSLRELFESEEAEIRQKIEEVLEQEINPGVASHGGVIRLLDVKGTTVFIEMGGGCQGCGMAAVTLKSGVETAIRNKVPQVTQILDTTDHASGNNPYYAPSSK